MSRIPKAAVTLINQVKQTKPRSVAEPHGDPDGLGVIRTIRFSKSAGDWLEPLLFEISDPRVVALDSEDGDLLVTFSTGRDADQRHAFPIYEAEEVISDRRAQAVDTSVDEPEGIPEQRDPDAAEE
jgi:hypothetical protein